MTNDKREFARTIAIFKARFMETSRADEENDCVHGAYRCTDCACDSNIITADTWKQAHDDIDDWGLQKTMSEIRALPERTLTYKDIPF